MTESEMQRSFGHMTDDELIRDYRKIIARDGNSMRVLISQAGAAILRQEMHRRSGVRRTMGLPVGFEDFDP